LDCFHPSAYAGSLFSSAIRVNFIFYDLRFSDAAFAIGLWNNLMGSKTTISITNDAIICPDENTFLQ